ncbi:MAG: hypothetical protein HYZ18_15515 [Pseudogulbenkiania sp.]|nr:hypothetical protein [Pseudogulbenkiania sp.]
MAGCDGSSSAICCPTSRWPISCSNWSAPACHSLPPSTWQRLRLSRLNYSEDVQLHNLQEPVPASPAQQVFSNVYQHHPHGDRDDTPEEWRSYH